MKLLSQAEARELDERLFGEYGYAVSQLMELAGQAVALAAARLRPQPGKILVIAGPGNNGGDGLVAARHLRFFGHQVHVLYPKTSKNQLMEALVQQSKGVGVEFLDSLPESLSSYELAIDAMFGFSFKPPVREPFGAAIAALAASTTPVLSVDIPSGWDVENGKPARFEAIGLELRSKSEEEADRLPEGGLDPAALISLTAPKLGVRDFQGRHFLGGRFLPDALAKHYQLTIPPYPGDQYIVELPS